MFLPEKSPGEFRPSREGDVSTLQPWQKLLLKAAALIEDRGWCQGTQKDARGRMCAIGAINEAEGNLDDGRCMPITKAGLEANKRLCAVVSPGDFGPAWWNNADGRTAEEVISTMRRIALTGK